MAVVSTPGRGGQGPTGPLARAQCGLPSPGVEWTRGRPGRPRAAGGWARPGSRVPLTCWYRLPQAGSTAASAANANAMALPAAGKEGERTSSRGAGAAAWRRWEAEGDARRAGLDGRRSG
jgi:hypothetical protein